jgi:hypothetical protein
VEVGAVIDRVQLLQRPIYGGVFGEGRYAIASMPCVSRGLYATRYMVVEPQAGAVLSMGEDKLEVLASARRVLAAANDAHQPPALPQQQLLLFEEPQGAPLERQGPQEPRPRAVSRRRRAIFEKSCGQCHYCSVPLQLEGKWHVEHMQPRALGGADDPLNLVAACVQCNLEKADRTALEFVGRSGR